MVMTVLEAEVDKKYWQVLQETYEEMTKEVPPIIKNSYLVQNQINKSIWRIITVWESQEVLDDIRGSGETPTGVIIFQKANSEPSLSIYDIHKVAVT